MQEASPIITVAYDSKIFTQQCYGGVSRYFYELLRGLSQSTKFRPLVVAPLHVNEYLGETPIGVCGLYIRQPRHPLARRIPGAVSRLLSPLIRRMIQPRIVHETFYDRALPARGVPVVTTVHDMIHELFPQYFPASDPTSARKKASVARADLVLCNSERTRRDLIDVFGVPEAKTRVTHLAASLAPPVAQPPTLPNVPYLLYVGARGGYKNFSALIKAYVQLGALRRDLRIVAFGGGPLTGAERDEHAALGLAEGELWWCSGGDGVLHTLYRGALALVYPSFYEGFGIPPIEAMSAGCPVLCSSGGSLAEVVGDAACIFAPDAPDELATRILELAESKSTREDWVRRGQRRAGEFSWQRCAQQTMAAYGDLL